MRRNICTIAFGLLLGCFAAAQAQETVKVKMLNAERQDVGEATITETPAGIVVTLTLEEKPRGVAPGVHAFHIHAVGKCEPPFTSAGGHYNPEGKKHGFLAKEGKHAGDLPNIHVPENGRLTAEFLVTGVTLKQGKNRLIDEDGSALVIHAKKDDYRTDPAGDAGDRIACGVIQGAGKSK